MSMQLAMHVEASVLNVVATGEFSLVEAKRTFLQMLEAVALRKSRKVLVDGREVIGEPEIMERFYYGEFAAESIVAFAERGVSMATRFAYVLREPVLDPGRFGETVAVNRGVRIKVFECAEEALRWLENGQNI